ncbi:MAG: S8 family serine peptidase, partial [Natronosporangium sp.]
GKVCHANGCPDSAIMAGMQWAAEQGADVVNLSLGGPDEPGTDQTEALVDSLTAEFGTLFVIAAGNDAADNTVNSPASAEAAVAVGAVDRQDQLAWFSSRGPRLDGALKPDLAAPGMGIVAAVPGGGYAASDGTSMATPHVSAAAAILVQQHPGWTPAQLTAALLGSAEPNPQTPVTGQGAGRLDISRAITQTVTTSPASLSFGRQVWPHDDLETLPITYRNDGAADLTLTLALATIGPDGQPAPDGLFGTGAPTVTVPAGGTAETTVTVDPRSHDLTGYFGGHLVATAPDGTPVVSTAFGVHLEVESYDLTMVHTDAAGNPASDYDTLLVGPLPQLETTRFSGDPTETLRMPAGEYILVSWQVIETPEGGERWTMLEHPQLELSEDTTIELDSRLARPVSVTVPGRPVELVYTGVYAQYVTDRWTMAANTFTFDPSGLYTAQLGPDDPVDELTTSVTGGWAVLGRDGRLESTEEMYHVAEFVDGGVPTGLDLTLHRRDLARVQSDHAVQTADGELFKGDGAIRLDPFVGALTPFMPLDGPSKRTDYYTTGGEAIWQTQLSESIPIDENHSDPVILLNAEPTTYRPGPQPRQRWNYGVFGPNLATEFAGVRREGDEMLITPELYADSAGHQGVVFGSGRITVFKDGELFAERFWLPGLSSFVAVPPEEAEYRVEVAAQRIGAATLSPQTNLAWTFRSGHTDGEVRAPTPVVRFHPPVDGRNSARSGLPFLVPVSVDSPSGSVALAGLTVDVSYDDGQSWRPAPTLPFIGGRLLLLMHPRGEGFVSLRAQATDRAGNTVEQTVLRAYQLR